LPAVKLAQLKSQIAALHRYIDEPKLFVYYLNEILDNVSSQKRILGENISIKSFLNQYHLPPSANLIVTETLIFITKQNPNSMLNVAKMMLESKILEVQAFAIKILGDICRSEVPLSYTLLCNSLNKEEDEYLQKLWVNEFIYCTTANKPFVFWDTLNNWIKSDDEKVKINAIRAIQSVLELRKCDNFPKILSTIEPLFLKSTISINTELIRLIHTLGEYSEKETVSFLKSLIQKSSIRNLHALLRRATSTFSSESRKSLRGVMD